MPGDTGTGEQKIPSWQSKSRQRRCVVRPFSVFPHRRSQGFVVVAASTACLAFAQWAESSTVCPLLRLHSIVMGANSLCPERHLIAARKCKNVFHCSRPAILRA